jgi:hypothetical protein
VKWLGLARAPGHPPWGDASAAWRWIVDYDEAGQIENLVVEENAAGGADLRDENGNCANCGLAFDSITSHGYPVCRSTVTITGDRGD